MDIYFLKMISIISGVHMGFINSPKALFIFSISFFLFAVIMFFVEEPDRKKRKKLRRLIYSIMALVFSLYYNLCKPYTWAYAPNNLGLPQYQYIFLLNLVIFVVVSILFDIFFISSYEIKSIGKDGISVTEEDLAAGQIQREAIELLDKKVDAEYHVIQEMDKFMVEIKPDIQLYLEITDQKAANKIAEDWIKRLLKKYINYQDQDLKFVIIDFDKKEIIKKDYGLRNSQYTEFLDLIETKGYIKQEGNPKILCLLFEYKFIDKRLIIVIENKEEIIKREQHLLENILNVFSNRLYYFAEFVLDEMETTV
jgi:hypothetical protein